MVVVLSAGVRGGEECGVVGDTVTFLTVSPSGRSVRSAHSSRRRGGGGRRPPRARTPGPGRAEGAAVVEHLEFEPSGDRAARLVDAVVRAQDAQRRLTARGRVQLGLGATDVAALLYVARAGRSSVTLGELAVWLDVTRAAASMVAKRLAATGHLHRVDDESDGRRRRLALTPRGREAVDEAFGAADREASALVATLDDAVVASVLSTLEQLTTVFDGHGSPESPRARRGA